MRNLLILKASHKEMTTSGNKIKGFRRWDFCAYTGEYYSEAGIGKYAGALCLLLFF
ncbi:hypothetical protein RF007C_01185 [Ruminococcus flavefaciens 007c]|uniref:Uncharacterized protein n=1 Tax=Ruminococcus flavefaciens 007c TaxID=1341157 RepID=W7UK35_RUMFL|nr:hypothetical protein RF007C_01185 [Ruminococcus flavefaciens 007c]